MQGKFLYLWDPQTNFILSIYIRYIQLGCIYRGIDLNPRQCKAYSQTSYRPYYMQAFFIFVTYRDIPPIWDRTCCWAYPTTDRAYSPSYRTISVAGPISPGYCTGLYRKKSEMPVPVRPFWSMTYTAPYCRPAMEICWNLVVCYQCNFILFRSFCLILSDVTRRSDWESGGSPLFMYRL